MKSYQYPTHCQLPSPNKTPEPQPRQAHNITRIMSALICAFCSRLKMIHISDYQKIFYVPHCNRNRLEVLDVERKRLKKFLLQAVMFISCKKLVLHKIIKK